MDFTHQTLPLKTMSVCAHCATVSNTLRMVNPASQRLCTSVSRKAALWGLAVFDENGNRVHRKTCRAHPLKNAFPHSVQRH